MFKESESKTNSIDEVSENEVLLRQRNRKRQSSILLSASTLILGHTDNSSRQPEFLLQKSSTSSDIDQDIYMEEKLVSWIESKLSDLKAYQPRFSFKPSLSLVSPMGGLFPSTTLGNVVGARL
jgi:hypothetical protein